MHTPSSLDKRNRVTCWDRAQPGLLFRRLSRSLQGHSLRCHRICTWRCHVLLHIRDHEEGRSHMNYYELPFRSWRKTCCLGRCPRTFPGIRPYLSALEMRCCTLYIRRAPSRQEHWTQHAGASSCGEAMACLVRVILLQ